MDVEALQPMGSHWKEASNEILQSINGYTFSILQQSYSHLL